MEAEEFVVACPMCLKQLYSPHVCVDMVPKTPYPWALYCVHCKGTGLLRIRAVRSEIPLIDRGGEGEK